MIQKQMEFWMSRGCFFFSELSFRDKNYPCHPEVS